MCECPAVRVVEIRAPQGADVVTAEEELGTGTRVDVTLRNPTRHDIVLDRVEIRTDHRPRRVLEHGYQSWSVVRPCAPDDVRPERAALPDWVRGTHLADPDGAGRHVAGDQFLLTDGGIAGFLDGRSHLSTVTAAPDRSVTAMALLDNVPLAPGAERTLDPLWLSAGDPGARYSEYARHWGGTSGARASTAAPLGWCSWYQYFGAVGPGDIRANLALAAAHRLDLVQIDDGYQAAIGDWLATAPGWPGSMDVLAGEIHTAGLEAGIWTAPFLAGTSSRLLAQHPEWVVVHESGHPARAMHNEAWGGWAYALDTTRPEVLDHIRTTFAAMRAQGFGYHKIDFCYAAALPGRRADATQTRAEALRAGIHAVREGIGDDAFLLGCGCPLAQAVGIVDAMRVSADTAPVWEPAAHWPGFAESAPAARNAIQASVLRAPLHRRLFVNDPDCLQLRPTDTHLSREQRADVREAIATSGAFVVLSDDLSLYGEDEWAIVDTLSRQRAAADVPIDLTDPLGSMW